MGQTGLAGLTCVDETGVAVVDGCADGVVRAPRVDVKRDLAVGADDGEIDHNVRTRDRSAHLLRIARVDLDRAVRRREVGRGQRDAAHLHGRLLAPAERLDVAGHQREVVLHLRDHRRPEVAVAPREEHRLPPVDRGALRGVDCVAAAQPALGRAGRGVGRAAVQHAVVHLLEAALALVVPVELHQVLLFRLVNHAGDEVDGLRRGGGEAGRGLVEVADADVGDTHGTGVSELLRYELRHVRSQDFRGARRHRLESRPGIVVAQSAHLCQRGTFSGAGRNSAEGYARQSESAG